MRPMKRFALTMALLLAQMLSAQPSQPEGLELGRKLTVGTREAMPFAMKSDHGEWTGISIDMWTEIAEEAGLEFEYVERDLEGLLEGVGSGELDLAVSALTITSERERTLDFSHPYYASGLGIAVRSDAKRSLFSMIRSIFSKQLMKTLLVVIILVFVVGLLVWLFERNRNPEQFGGTSGSGLWSGFWWSAVTMTTVGYGDKSPVTPGGRIIALVWMITGLVAISTLTASMASALTLNELQGGITGSDDLPGASVGTIRDSTSAEWLDARAIGHDTYDDAGAALSDLAEGKLDAVIYDFPILQYLSRRHYQDTVRVLDESLGRQDYGVAFPQESPLREIVNRRILELIEGREWQSIRSRYLGDGER